MKTRVADILAAVVASIGQIDGEGDYTHNLATHGQVKVGTFDAPPASPPFVAVQLEEVSTAVGAPLSSRTWTATLRLAGWTHGAPKHAGDRMVAACDLLDDLRLALLADPMLGGLTLDMEVAAAPFLGEGQRQAAAWGRVEMVLKVLWRETA